MMGPDPWGRQAGDVWSPDGLVDMRRPIVTEDVVVAAGAGVLPRGAVLGLVTATGKAMLSDPAATDGSQVPSAVLAAGVDATTSDCKAPAYLAGTLAAGALTYASGWTLTALVDALRRVGLRVAC